MTGPSQTQRAGAFRAMHEGEPFVIPNPWDAGSARMLAALGFRALATTSAGFALTMGRRDGDVTLDEVIAHTADLCAATELPVSVDLENGYGRDPEQAARAITAAAEAGAVGGSIEDYDPSGEIYDRSLATERVAAASEAARALDFPFTLTARAENHLRGNPDLDDTIARLCDYERAGGNVLYAPALRDTEQIEAVCQAVAVPVNVLALPHLEAGAIFAAGAQRISLGSSLAWVAYGAGAAAATAIRDVGDLSTLRAQMPPADWLG